MKIFANYVKGLVSEYLFLELNNNKTKSLIKITKASIEIGSKLKNSCSASLVIRKLGIQPAMSNQYTPVRMAKIKMTAFTQCCRRCGRTETSIEPEM